MHVRFNAAQADTTKPTMVGRSASGFTLNVIDTPGLLDGDYVNQRALNSIAKFVDGKPIHAARLRRSRPSAPPRGRCSLRGPCSYLSEPQE